MEHPTDEEVVKYASKKHNEEGTVEIDAKAVVSRADDNSSGGAYVQAWVWVADEDVREHLAQGPETLG